MKAKTFQKWDVKYLFNHFLVWEYLDYFLLLLLWLLGKSVIFKGEFLIYKCKGKYSLSGVHSDLASVQIQ